MKYVLMILLLALMFITACGNNEVETNDLDKVVDIEDTPLEDIPLDCQDGYVEVEGECLPIDPYSAVEKDVDEVVVVEEPVEEVVESETLTSPGHKTFEVTVENYHFTVDGKENPDLIVQEGDNVTIILTSIEGSHSWNVRQLAARSKTVSTNETTTLNFIASEKGVFDYYCAVGKHQNIGGKGTFIVE